jgi:anti-sigma-K factor RskA
MARPEDLEDLAAEFALGTLPADERAEAERLLAADPSFAALVRAWEARLGPLAAALPPQSAPPHVRGAVMKAIAGGAPDAATVVDFRQKARFWRGTSIITSAIAASLAALIVFNQVQPPPVPEQRYVAVLQPEGPGPAFLASIDLAKGSISVRTVAAPPQPGKAYELWAIGGGRAKPQSLGVIDASYRVPADRLGAVDPQTLTDTIFAVTVEPEGGSPTGNPSGPPVFTGKLVATE